MKFELLFNNWIFVEDNVNSYKVIWVIRRFYINVKKNIFFNYKSNGYVEKRICYVN